MSQRKKKISFVIPVYNEEENIPKMFAAVNAFIEARKSRYDFEIIVTDNHSTDASQRLLAEEVRSNPRLKVFRFSRNFGHQKSILTGYKQCTGDAAVQLDCDLQDPLEVVDQFLSLWEQGHKVVYGIRAIRQEGFFITATRKIFYRIIDMLSEVPLPRDVGDFCLIDRQALDFLVKCEDRQPYIRGYLAELGFSRIGVEYARNSRIAGESKFSTRDLWRLAMDGITNHSIIPLRLASFFGIFVSICMLLLLLGYVAGKIWFGVALPPGFTTLTVLILFSLSLNALFFGIIGEYLGRIFKQVKGAPLTVIESSLPLSGTAIREVDAPQPDFKG
jgi:dolichol-phosphate mannosyltransferase